MQTFRAEILFHLSIVIFQQRSRYVEYAVYFISGSVFTNIVSTQCLWRIYTQYLWPATDSWVNTALQQVCHSGLTGLETSWDFWLIAEWLCLLPSSAWLKLYLSPLTTNAKIFSDLSETFFSDSSNFLKNKMFRHGFFFSSGYKDIGIFLFFEFLTVFQQNFFKLLRR